MAAATTAASSQPKPAPTGNPPALASHCAAFVELRMRSADWSADLGLHPPDAEDPPELRIFADPDFATMDIAGA